MANADTSVSAASTRAPSWRRRLLRIGLILLCAYAGVILVLMFFENWLVFHPTAASRDWQPPPSGNVQDVFLTSADGTRIHAWWYPAAGAKGAVLYCHGNAGNLSHRGDAIHALRQILGESVLIFDYPGYGKSEGRPSEQGCYAAADAAYDWLVNEQHLKPENILLYGGSLGGGIAVDLAFRREKYRGLVLAKTFCSLPDVGQSIYPWLPVRWLMRNRFDSLSKISALHQPVFIGHGAGDELIPYEQGRKLFDAANQPKEFFTLDGNHNAGLSPEFFTRLKAFLETCERKGSP